MVGPGWRCRADVRRALRARCTDQRVDLLRVDHQDAHRQLRDTELIAIIATQRQDKRTGKFVQTLGSRKMWIRLRGQGHDVARCTVERIMRENGWEGARYGSKHKTTTADDSHVRYPDLVDRRSTPQRQIDCGWPTLPNG